MNWTQIKLQTNIVHIKFKRHFNESTEGLSVYRFLLQPRMISETDIGQID